jgi:hypothetical protein
MLRWSSIEVKVSVSVIVILYYKRTEKCRKVSSTIRNRIDIEVIHVINQNNNEVKLCIDVTIPEGERIIYRTSHLKGHLLKVGLMKI